jgi:hypothetical protein
MELNTLSLSDFVRNAQIMWLKGLDSVPMVARNSGMFRVEPVAQNTGNTREYSEIDLENYAKHKGEGAQSERARVQQGYTKIAKLKRIAMDIGITYEMRTQNKYSDVVARLTNLGALTARRMELDLQHRIGFGTATSYVDLDGDTVDTTVGDGLSLFNTAHTVRGSATTYRNRLAGNAAFSKTALEGMETLCVEETINQFGEKMAMPYDILWSTDDPTTINTMLTELNSQASTTLETNAGVVNVNRGKYRHVALPLVATDNTGAVDNTKATYWGLASSMFTSAYLGIHEEPRLKTPPTEGNNAEEFSTDDWNFGTRAGYFICIVSGNWIKFSSGDGTP